ncbi:uncharacterized protein LOC122118954 [Dipodomys spectabilis]|uniref:uncharacterized protein LOC122118954 n=1 Tax=Dipodomys spectabilis TaxID=105255 RepID=UPI001C54869D|nr:uncharacterized protein LOC122118954 [Dipodomys spectabilis]
MEPDAGKHLQAARHPLPPPRPPLSPDSAPAGNRHAPRVLVLIASLLPCPFHFIPRGRENRPRLPIELFKERERKRGKKEASPAKATPGCRQSAGCVAQFERNCRSAPSAVRFGSGEQCKGTTRRARSPGDSDARRCCRWLARLGLRGPGSGSGEKPREAQIMDTTSPANARAGCIRKVCGLQAIFISFESTVSRLCVVVCTAVVKMNKMTACLLLKDQRLEL